MKKHKLAVIIVAALVLLTAVLAVVHLTTRQQEQEGALQIIRGGKTTLVYIDDMRPVAAVSGTVVNNAGEEKQISGYGILVSDVLKLAGVKVDSEVIVTSADEYSVRLTAEEVSEEGRAWLMLEEDTLRLIVFGDQGAKRNVKNVARLNVN